MHFIQTEIGAVSGRAFGRFGTVLDKAWAAKVVWVGKNNNLITQKSVLLFIAELIIDLELEYDSLNNRSLWKLYRLFRCVCPTEAIVVPYVVDGSKCISYFTIELKDNSTTK